MSRFLNELEASRLLLSYNIPMAKSFLCRTLRDAVNHAEKLKFPVAMKILSWDILHKTDAECVFVGINNKEELKETFELIMKNAVSYKPNANIDGILIQEMARKGIEIIIGMKNDPQFGPIIMVGTGGIYVEIFKDVALRLLPITRYDAEEMLRETKVYEIIRGARGKLYDIDKLIDVMLKISELVKENTEIEEIDINPFFLYEKGGKGVDALIKLS